MSHRGILKFKFLCSTLKMTHHPTVLLVTETKAGDNKAVVVTCLDCSCAFTATISLRDKNHIPGPAAELGVMRVLYFPSIAKAVAEFVLSLGFLIIKVNRLQAEFFQTVQLRSLREAVVVNVPPQTQRGEDRILPVDFAIRVTAVLCFVVFGECQESVSAYSRWRLRLRRKVPEKLSSILNQAVNVAVESEP